MGLGCWILGSPTFEFRVVVGLVLIALKTLKYEGRNIGNRVLEVHLCILALVLIR